MATALAMVAAPLLDPALPRPTAATPTLATDFAYLLLPQIFFYGMGALFGAILNSRANFGPAAWAPVLNNVVALVALGVYACCLPRSPRRSASRARSCWCSGSAARSGSSCRPR